MAKIGGMATAGILALLGALAAPTVLFGLPWPSSPYFAVAVSSWFVYAYSVLRGILETYSGKRPYLRLSFWAFMAVFAGLAPYGQAIGQFFPWAIPISATEALSGCLLIWVAIAGYEIGLLRTHRERSLRLQFQPRALNLAIGTVIMLVLTVIGITLTGGIGTFFLARREFGDALGSSESVRVIVSTLARAPSLLVAVVLGTVAQSPLVKVRRTTLLVGSSSFALLALVLGNPISTPRFWVATVLISIVLVAIRPRTRPALAVSFGALLLIMTIVFPVADYFRNSVDPQEATSERLNLGKELKMSPDYDAFQMSVLVMHATRDSVYVPGEQAIGALTFWVPRTVWPDKPEATGSVAALHAGMSFTNVSAPLWSEGFSNLWWPGAFGIMYLLGRGTRRLETRIENGCQLTSALVPLLAGLEIFLLRGSLQPVLAFVAPVVVLALLFYQPVLLRRPMEVEARPTLSRHGPQS